MLLLSQNKTQILNLDNISNIKVENTFIKAYFNDGRDEILGAYRTRNRAQDVLLEILIKYEEYRIIKHPKKGIINAISLPKVYKIPKE